jgi:hypothetical protein
MQNHESDDVLLPPWASGMAHGNYLAVGAMLPTRDGRRMGNAIVEGVDAVAVSIMTDAGTKVRMTAIELAEQFWPPTWIRKKDLAKDQRGAVPFAQAHAMLSIADSLKRIADVVDPADGQGDSAPLTRL